MEGVCRDDQEVRVVVGNCSLTIDDPSGHTAVDGSENVVKNSKVLSVVAKEFMPADIKDVTPLVTRVLRQSPDAIDVTNLGGSPNIINPLVKALSDQGFKGVVIGNSGNADVMRDSMAALKNFDAFVYTAMSDYNSPLVSDQEKGAIKKYLAKYPEADLEPGTVPGYDMPLVLAQAIEKAGTVDDAVKVAQTLREGQWDTVAGKAKFVGAKTFGLPAVLEQPVYLSKIDNGKAVMIARLLGTMP